MTLTMVHGHLLHVSACTVSTRTEQEKTTQNLNPQAMPAMSGKAILKHAHSLTQRGILNHGGVNGTGKPAHE